MLTRRVRGSLLIAAALLAMGAGAARVLWPKPAEAPRPAPVARAAPSPTGRPIGVLHLGGREIPSPQLVGDELGFVAALARSGATVERIDPSPWSDLYDQAVVDTVITDRDIYFVFAPEMPGRGRWVCPAAAGGAIIGGGDAPNLEVGIGGDRATLQAPSGAAYGAFGEVIVMAASARAWERVQALMQPVGCPSG